jgi:hypothetical protein
MPACFSEQGGSHTRGGASAPQINGEITMTYETKEQQRKRLYAEILRQLREAPPETRINMPVEIEDDCIDDVDRASNPIGRFFRHNAMHAGTTRMVLDEFGRCAYCVKRGFWKPDA